MSNDPIFAQLQAVLRCPITHENLRLLSKAEIRAVNGRLAKDGLSHSDRRPVEGPIEAGFISASGGYVYPIIDGIIILLAHLSIPVDAAGAGTLALRPEKKILQDFYDQVGWLKAGGKSDPYMDALKWEDLRPVAQEYARRCRLRVNRYLSHSGKYLLDAGSGPVQYEEYLSYSEGYDYRICLDISLLALREARKKLGQQGIYILGDITDLPFLDSSMDGAVSLHTIYHVPADEQIHAFRELQRVIRPGTSAAVVYSWKHRSLLMDLYLLPRKVQQAFRRIHGKAKGQPAEKLYHHVFDHQHLVSALSDLEIEIYPWRSLGVPFMKAYIHRRLLGRRILNLVYAYEERFPRLAARKGEYPLLVIRKRQ